MDAGKYYALLRFEEAARALRTALRLNIVDEIGARKLTMDEFRELFGFTNQGARTYAALLEVMEVISRKGDLVSVPERARVCLQNDVPTSRRAYLSMGSNDEADELISMLRGEFGSDSMPLYGGGDATEKTIMDLPEVGEGIAIGLASRARSFAEPLAAAIKPHSGKAKILADIGAGSPYLAAACLQLMPHLAKVAVVDRPNGMAFLRRLAEPISTDLTKVEMCEQDFFQAVPPADIYVLSNTAHDWLPDEYSKIMTNIRDAIAPGGIICIHEPLLSSTWSSADEWVHALWMACYALTLYCLTEGKGTCYTQKEHDWILQEHGFSPLGEPTRTSDGCTALVYGLSADASSGPERATMSQPRTA